MAQKKPETKREKFVRLASARVGKCIKNMRSVANLARPGSYDFTDADVEKINDVVVAEWETAMKAFSGKAEKPKTFALE